MSNLLLFPDMHPDPKPGPRHSGQQPPDPPDAPARRQALDTTSSFIVQAPAGSGKTGLLIQRFLKLLADDSVARPEQVLALTFTIKATAEMRDRVLHALRDADAPADPDASPFDTQTRLLAEAVLLRDRALGWNLLDHPHLLQIRTIDSLCAHIARTLPVLSGSGGRLAPADDAAPLYREAARRTLLLLGADPIFDRSLRDLLLHRDANLADVESLLAEMLNLRDQWAQLIPLAAPALTDEYLDTEILPKLELALEHAICAALTRLTRAIPPDFFDDLVEISAELGHLDGHAGNPSPIAICAGRTQSPRARAGDLEHWRGLIALLLTGGGEWRKGFSANHTGFESRPHKARLTALVDRVRHRDDLRDLLCGVRTLPPVHYPADQWAVAKSLFRVLSRALVELQFVFAARGECDFTQVSLLARHALRDDSGPEDLALALGSRLQHLLVDEMQDTSTGQYELLHLLTQGWDGHSQTVFLVGDPRQSIYLFRQARVERFVRTMRTERLGDLPLTRLQLTANFRSQQTLVLQANDDFAAIFPNATADADAEAAPLPYADAHPTKPATAAPGRIWHANPIPPPVPATTSAQLRRQQSRDDAAEIARIATRWIATPLPADRPRFPDGTPKPWQIAVLVRGRSHLADIVPALKSAAIPIRAVEVESLSERQEILDLTALTRALLHPADRVAALAILRAPWCGLGLADLHTLTGIEEGISADSAIPRLIETRGHLLPDTSLHLLTRVWRVLREAALLRGHLTLAQLVQRAWRTLGGDAPLTPAELLNARRFFQLLDELDRPGTPIDPAVLATRLHTLYAEPEIIPAGTPCVELLTIHKAKGLEWDVVIVPALERPPAVSRYRLLTWAELDAPEDGEAAHIMLAPIHGRGQESAALNRWLRSIERARELAEVKRVLYVACTRAREELHLFAAPDVSASQGIVPRPDSLLNAAWPAAEPHFTHPPVIVAATPSPIPFAARLRDAIEDSTGPAIFDIAAAFEPRPRRPRLHRLPESFDPAARLTAAQAGALPYGDLGDPGFANPAERIAFARPEGSFAARAFGNAVHGFLELLAAQLAAPRTPAELLAELPSWTARISATLRAAGLAPATLPRLAQNVRAALEATLRDPDGLWLLSPHPAAATEYALIAAQSSIRIDRTFLAGPTPRTPESQSEAGSCLWIVDYKTTTHGPQGLETFLDQQRTTYAPQLEAYARTLAPTRPPNRELRLALYYPTLPRLLWWAPAD
jgi:ATP-dependent helicase/nuclease subunit A